MTRPTPLIAGLGEILWDVFPDGPRFGGAPANFACTTAELGGQNVDVTIVSGVGQDALGQQALHELQRHRVQSAAVEQLPFPTGRVDVTLDSAGHPTYQFATDSAWDHLEWRPELQLLAEAADVVCFGTLGQRSSASRQTIQRFLRTTRPQCLRLLDINLRDPFWGANVIVDSLKLADALKLNADELRVLADLMQLHGDDRQLLKAVMKDCSLQFIALTRGAGGSLILRDSGECSELEGTLVAVVDTVGAGDAFTAAMVLGLLRDSELAVIHQQASAVASFVCTQPGATPDFPQSLRTPGS